MSHQKPDIESWIGTKLFLILMLALFSLETSAQGQAPAALSAWEEISRADPVRLEGLPELERRLMKLLTVEQLQGYLKGEPPEGIVLFTGESLEEFLRTKTGEDFMISWFTLDGGGVVNSEGGSFKLSGSIGQPDAMTNPMSGGSFVLTGGFWVGLGEPVIADCTASGVIFCDGFESGDTQEWSFSEGKQ